MVTVNLNGQRYYLASSWDDVDADKLIACKDFRDELKALSTIPHDLIDKADIDQLTPLYTVISFINEAELMPAIDSMNVIRRSYRKFKQAEGKIKLTAKPHIKLLLMARVYYPKEKNSVRLIGLGISILDQIVTFLERYSDMIHDPPEKNAVEAGIEELSAFSYWGTAYTMAGRDLLKVDSILRKPAIEVYTALYYSWKESKYNKRKWELDNPPTKK